MKKNKILFSIITPVLNDVRILKNIQSIQNQSLKDYEHIIVDGGSDMPTLNILKKKYKKTRVIFSKKDAGIYDAINKGIKKSSGNIIGILNADDYYYKSTLKNVKSYFLNYDLDFLFGSVMKDRLHHGYWPKKIYWKFNIFPSHSCGFFVKKKLHNKVGFYDLRFKYSSDRDFIYKIIRKKYNGMCAKKYQIFGKFNPHGISSKISIFNDLKEQFFIRLNNNQNILYLIFLFIITFFYKVLFNFFRSIKLKF
jgi:glycosyltransferase involved in cell wall biosynthesis